MKFYYSLLFTLTFVCFGNLLASEGQPNILLIYSDDQGWADLGIQGIDKDIRTPNLDQLARDGVRFTRGYVSAPLCAPSRAGVLTGRYQQRFGVEDNRSGRLPLEERTIAERLKLAGYISGQVGKWHLDLFAQSGLASSPPVVPEYGPRPHGFDEYWEGDYGQYFASHDLQNQPLADAPKEVNDDRFRVVVQTEAALAFLDRRSAKLEQPWFLYLAYFAPHMPLESPEPWFAKTPEQLPKQRRQALAMMAAMDEGIGKIREKLKAMGENSETLIFFIGDNGAPLSRGAWNGSMNTPLIGEKAMLTDGGLRVPFLAAWPGKIAAGTVYEHPVINLDVAATAVAVAGQPHDDHLDGVNLMPFLLGNQNSQPHETLYWRLRSQASVLEFPWKLIRLGPTQRYLFNVTTPDGEIKNQINEHPEIANRLEAKLKSWSETLQPPGLSTEVNYQDKQFFATYVDQALDRSSSPDTTGKQKRD